jgi:hypothetical protein
MAADRHGLFRPLEPPPGGAERFRQRLGAGDGPRARARSWRAAFAASAALVLVVSALLLWVQREPAPETGAPATSSAEIYDAPQFDRLLGRPVERSAPMVTVNERAVTLAEVRSENEKIRIYTIDRVRLPR